MKKVYENEKDIDGYLYFAGIVNNLSRRLSIYQYIYSDIILKKDFKNGEHYVWMHRVLNTYSSLNLWSKINEKIIKNITESSEIYFKAKNLTDTIKESIFNESIINHTDNRIHIDNIAKTTYYLTNDYQFLIVNVSLFIDLLNNELNNYYFNIKIRLDNREMMKSMILPLNNNSIKCTNLTRKSRINLNFDAKLFIMKLKQKNYDEALEMHKIIRSNNYQTVMAIVEYYDRYFDIETILNLADLITDNEEEQAIVYNSVYYIVNKSDTTNICDMIRLHNRYLTLNTSFKLTIFVNSLKEFISSAIKKDFVENFPKTFNIENYFNLSQSNYDIINIYTKENNQYIGSYKYEFIKENSENDYCYFNIEISRYNYENWYWKNGINSSLKFNDFLEILTKHKRFMEVYKI
ncbi:hypothetical protein O3M35_003061 [Rhynocoris fuscipes]